jgi:tripartite-type tricarboxylate transporter receptor subunit TctC
MLSTPALANNTFPTKPIRFVVPTAPGGNLDFTARFISSELKTKWPQEIIVDNRAGAGTTIGSSIVAKSRPDGHSMLFTSSSYATNAALYSKLPFDPLKDLSPVMLLGNSQLVLVTNSSVNIKTVADLINKAKETPHSLNFSTTGIGTGMHLANELLKSFAKIETTHIPFKGSVPALQSLISNDTQYSIAGVTSILPLVKAQKISILAVTGSTRSQILPNIPTIGETIPGYEFNNWFGILIPAGTPKHIVIDIYKTISFLINLEKNKKVFLTQAIEIQTYNPAEFGKLLHKEIEKYSTLSNKIGLKIDQ